jgi:phosphatidylglycerol:prolipoprotein diacylglycerol transferase
VKAFILLHFFLMVAFSIFGFSIYWYGIFYVITFLFAYFFLSLVMKKWVFEYSMPGLHRLLTTSMEDIFFYSVLGVLLGWRLWHIFIYDFAYYLKHPLEMIMVWKWGMSFIWGIVWVVTVLVIFIWKHKISLRDFFALWDVLLIPTAFWIMIGRVGNFLNQELYGIPVSGSFMQQFPHITSYAVKLWLFHVYSRIDQVLRINTNMLSSIFEWGLLFLVLSFVWYRLYMKKTRFPGLLVWIFFVWYSVVRFCFEYIRADSQLEFIGRFTKSQWFFLWFAILWVLLLIFRKRIFDAKR